LVEVTLSGAKTNIFKMVLFFMENFKIIKEGIVIIQWLRICDTQLSEVLYNAIRHKEKERENYFVEYYKVDSRDEFQAVLQELIYKTKKGTLFTLHIVSHGNEDGIGTEFGNIIRWGKLFHYTRQLNVTMGNNLLLVLSSCVGGGIISHIEPEERAPYRAIIGNTREVFASDAQKGFAAFYADYYNIIDFPKAIRALNREIDITEEIEPRRKKTEFFIMTAEHSFNEVFNPDRDPIAFERIINKLMPPNFIIPQELRIKKAKELFIKRGEELKPYFCFLD